MGNKQQPVGTRKEVYLEEAELAQRRVSPGVCIIPAFLLHHAFRFPKKARVTPSAWSKRGSPGC